MTSFNRPGGNVTGISFVSGESAGKRLELLRQLVPGAATIGVMIDPRMNEGVAERRDLEAAAKAVRQQLFVIEITADRDLEPAFASLVERKAGALLIGAGPFLTARQRQLAALALRHNLPMAGSLHGFVEAGGLMSYGASITMPIARPASMPDEFLKASSRPTCRAAGQQVRFRHQPGNRESARPFRADAHSRRRRRGN